MRLAQPIDGITSELCESDVASFGLNAPLDGLSGILVLGVERFIFEKQLSTMNAKSSEFLDLLTISSNLLYSS